MPDCSTPTDSALRVAQTTVYLAWALAAMMIASLLMSLLMRFDGATWGEVGTIGDFWGGHLNGLALVFLALSFFLQQREFRRQTIQIDRQLVSQRLEFLLERLRVAGEEFRYSIDEPQRSGRNRVIRTGLFDFAREAASRQHLADGNRLIVEPGTLPGIVDLYNAALKLMVQSSGGHREIDRLVLGSFVPDVVLEWADAERKETSERQVGLRSLAKAQGLRQDLVDAAEKLVSDGWNLRIVPQASAWVALVERDFLAERVGYDSGGTFSEPGHALEDVVLQVEEAQVLNT